MKILVLYPYIPYPTDRGTYQRTYHLLRALAARHEVHLVALSEAGERLEQQAHFESFCHRVTLVPFEHPEWPRLFPDRLLHPLPTSIRHWSQPHIARAIRAEMAAHTFDLVHVCDIVMAQYFLDEHQDVPLSVDRSRVDLQYQIARHEAMGVGAGWKERLLHEEQILKLRRFERRVARRAQMQVVCGPDDEVFVHAEIDAEAPVRVVANGVDLDFFNPDSCAECRSEKPTLLFCGAMDYAPNVDALRWFFAGLHARLLAEVSDLEVLIVGRSPVPEVEAHARHPGVTVTGGVADVRPFYRRAWAQIVPLRIGGGTRLKIPESMAIGTPVVSTSIGAQGLGLRHDVDILLADTEERFAQETARLLKDPALREAVTVQGMLTCRQRLGWEVMGRQLCDACAAAVKPASPSSSTLLHHANPLVH